MKKLDRDWDFSEVIQPLLTDQGPASATILRLSSSKQIVCLKKIGDEFLTKQQRETPGSSFTVGTSAGVGLSAEPIGPIPKSPSAAGSARSDPAGQLYNYDRAVNRLRIYIYIYISIYISTFGISFLLPFALALSAQTLPSFSAELAVSSLQESTSNGPPFACISPESDRRAGPAAFGCICSIEI